MRIKERIEKFYHIPGMNTNNSTLLRVVLIKARLRIKYLVQQLKEAARSSETDYIHATRYREMLIHHAVGHRAAGSIYHPVTNDLLIREGDRFTADMLYDLAQSNAIENRVGVTYPGGKYARQPRKERI